MPVSLPLLIGGIAGLLLLIGIAVYVLHPVRRKEQRLTRSCDKAFGRGNYRLTRIRLPGANLFLLERLFFYPNMSSRRKRVPYTYKITPADGVEPDYSGMSDTERARVRHYLNIRHSHLPHGGTKAIRQIENSGSGEAAVHPSG